MYIYDIGVQNNGVQNNALNFEKHKLDFKGDFGKTSRSHQKPKFTL